MNRSKSIARKVSGWQSKRRGVAFESWIEKSFERMGWHIEKIHDGCRVMGMGGRQLRRVKQPFDYVAVGSGGRVIFFDAKFRSGSENLTRSVLGLGESALLKRGSSTVRQLESLEKFTAFGHLAGFIVYLQDIDRLYFVSSTWAAIEPNAHKIEIGSYAKGINQDVFNELFFKQNP